MEAMSEITDMQNTTSPTLNCKRNNPTEFRIHIKDDKENLQFTKEKQRNEREEYKQFGCVNADINPKTFVLTPSMLNPNSYESI